MRKALYPYEYMDSWEKFDETSMLDKEAFYNELNKEGITNEDYAHYEKYLKNIVKIWEIIMIYMFNQIRFCLLMFLKISELCVLKNISLIHHIFIQHQDYHGKHV